MDRSINSVSMSNVCVWLLATQEMVQILQEYGEVVCCFGSSASVENTAIFLQADCRSYCLCTTQIHLLQVSTLAVSIRFAYTSKPCTVIKCQ